MQLIKQNKKQIEYMENYNKIINNSKFKDILCYKANTDKDIIKRIQLLKKINKCLNYIEIVSLIGFSIFAFLTIRDDSASDISYTFRDYVAMLALTTGFLATTPLVMFGVRMCITDIFFKRKGKLFDFTANELIKISQQLTQEEMKDLLIFIEQNRDVTILRSINFEVSQEEERVKKEINRNLLVEHIYNIKEKDNDK